MSGFGPNRSVQNSSIQALQSELDALQADIEEVQDLTTPVSLTYSSILTLTRSGSMVYAGADTDVELSALPTHVPGATIVILFPAGTITGDHLVTLADSLNPPSGVANGEIFDPALNYRVWVTAITATQVTSAAVACVDVDVIPPEITDAAVSGDDTDAIIVTFSETVTWSTIAGFYIPAHTITGVSEEDGYWVLQLSDSFVVDENRTLSWTSANTVYDLTSNHLAASSISITNTIGYPAIESAAVNEDVLTIVFSEAVIAAGVTGLSLSGTSSVFDSVSSGSGTTTVIFALDEFVTSEETVTLTVASVNDISSVATSLSLQAIADVEVVNNTSTGVLWEDTFDVDDFTWADGSGGATYSIHDGVLTRTDFSGYEILYNPTDTTLPAAYTLTAIVPHVMVSTAYWGIAALFDDTDNSGIRVFISSNPSNLTAGNSIGYNTDNLTITVTGGFPASWSVDQDHTFAVTVHADGTCQIILDGLEYGTFTSTVNQGETGLGVAMVGEGNNRDWLGIKVEAI